MKQPTFLHYLPEDSVYLKISFLKKFLIFFFLSLFVLLFDSIILNVAILIVTVSLILPTGFHKHNTRVFKYLVIALLIFSAFWIFLSKVPGEVVYFTTPWNTYFTNQTVNLMVLAASKWASVVLIGLLFMMTTNEKQLINQLINLNANSSTILFFTTLFNTIGFSIKELNEIQTALRSRGFEEEGIKDKINKVKYIGSIMIFMNLKRIEILGRCYLLRKKKIIKGLKEDA